MKDRSPLEDSFQPEKPYGTARGNRSWTTPLVVALVSALFVMMLFALAAPRLFGEEGTSWTVTLVAGGVVFVVALLLGLRGTKQDVAD